MDTSTVVMAADGRIDAQAMRSLIMQRGHELAEEGGSLLAAIKSAPEEGGYFMPLAEAKAKAKAFAGTVEKCRELGKAIVAKALAVTGADIALRQLDDRFMTFSTKADPETTYAKLAAIAKEITAATKYREEAEKPAAPVRAVPILLYATDEAVRKLCADIKAGKRAGIAGYQFAPDEATERKIVKMLEPKPEK